LLHDLTYHSLEYICLNMRAVDRREIYATQSHDNAILLAKEVFEATKLRGRGRIAWSNGRPSCFAGFIEVWPGNWQIAMFGTDKFKDGAIELLRWIRSTIPELISELGGRRLSCHSWTGHTEAQQFLEALGAEREGPPLRDYGKNGETFQHWTWFADTSRSAMLKRPEPSSNPQEEDLLCAL